MRVCRMRSPLRVGQVDGYRRCCSHPVRHTLRHSLKRVDDQASTGVIVYYHQHDELESRQQVGQSVRNGEEDRAQLWMVPVAFLALSALMGIICSVGGLLLATGRWIIGMLGWQERSQGWLELFLGYLAYAWTLALFMVAVVVTYTVLVLLVVVAFRVTRKLTNKRMALFAQEYPTEYEKLMASVGDVGANIGVWWLCSLVIGIVSLCAYIAGVRSPAWIITASVTGVLGIFYVAMLINVRTLGRWAFWRVRGLMLPYVVFVAPIFVVLSFATLFQYKLVAWFFALLGNDFYALGGIEPEAGSTPSQMDLPFSWQPAELYRVLAASVALLVLVVWLTPIFIAREWAELITITLIFTAAWVGSQLDEQPQIAKSVAIVFKEAPLPLIALVLAVVVDRLFDVVAAAVGNTYRCPKCGSRSRPTIRFCSQCGTAKQERSDAGDRSVGETDGPPS
jgi:hypothetical protein